MHAVRVCGRVNGEGSNVNKPCMYNGIVNAGDAHRHIQYRPLLQFLASQERNVVWLLLGIALLPVDGTTLGLYAPFWSPISPALFTVYCLCNWRQLRIVANRYLPLFLLPVICVVLSVPGWVRFGFHLNAAFMSVTGLLGMLATLAALAIAFDRKQIPWRMPLRILIASYWCSFAVGVVQWAGLKTKFTPIINYFKHLMYREYIELGSVWGGGRVQFLFAEPSYIGMHLFGILLPLMWLMRGRDRIYAKRLRDLVVVYACCAVLMHAGARIVVDSVVALLIAIVVQVRWNDRRQRVRGTCAFVGMTALGVCGMLANHRLASIVRLGAMGDSSFFARIYQSLDPLCGFVAHPWMAFTGFGAGNIYTAMQNGDSIAERMLNGLGMDGHLAVGFVDQVNVNSVWTMCAYTSVVVEYGLIGMVLLVIASLACASKISTYGDTVRSADGRMAVGGNGCGSVGGRTIWHKTTFCWLILLSYLYVQCENYAFAALPLFVFAARKTRP